jgi:hypothetical protein
MDDGDNERQCSPVSETAVSVAAKVNPLGENTFWDKVSRWADLFFG